MTAVASAGECLSEDIVTRFLERRLSIAERDSVVKHADRCEGCRRLLSELAWSITERAQMSEQVTEPQVQRPRSGRDRRTVGRFVVIDLLGAGGMGVVYHAYDPELDRKIALKLLHPDDDLDPNISRARIVREAQAMAKLQHEHVVTVYDVGTVGGNVFIAMELVDGSTLRQWLTTTRSWREIVEVFVRAGRGLEAAHAVELVHRDFKPDNVLVGRNGRVKVMDFGLAASVDANHRRSYETMERVAGTPAYMAPEQFAGGAVDARSDQFSFCVALHEALYGARPFEGTSISELAAAVASGSIRPFDDARVPRWLRRIVSRGLATDPTDRHPSMASLLDELAAGLHRRRRAIVAGAALALLAGGSVVSAVALGGEPAGPTCDGAPARIATVWGVEQQAAIRAAFVATRTPFAEDAWQGVERALAAYTASWSSAHAHACEATNVKREESPQVLDLRMACLDDRLAELDSLVAIFRRADAAVVGKAVQASRSLSSIETCSGRASALSSIAPPADAVVAQQVQAVRLQLAQSRAAERAGRPAEAQTLAERARDAARPLAFKPILAQALYELGRAQERAGNPAAARASLEEAALVAETARDDTTRAAALLHLVGTIGISLGEKADVEPVKRAAQAIVERLGDDRELRGRLHFQLGRLLQRQQRSEEAIVELELALADLQVARGDDDPLGFDILSTMANAHATVGRHDKANEIYVRVLERRRVLFGKRHPSVGIVLTNMAVIRSMQGRLDEELALSLEALSILEPGLGANHPQVGTLVNNLSAVYTQRGDAEQALAYARRSLASTESRLGPTHLDVAFALFNLAEALLAVGDHAGALAAHERSLEIRIARLGADDPRTADGHMGLAKVLLDLDPKRAERESRRALALQRVASDPRGLGEALEVLANALVNQRRYREAVPVFEEAVTIKTELANDIALASRLTGLAHVRLQLGKPRDAIEPLERALAIQRREPGQPFPLATTLFALAKARVATGADPAGAVAFAEEAMQLYAKVPGPVSASRQREIKQWVIAHRVASRRRR
jgi:tetratricopeptide (TPR) repeat protein/predicted Ser/Thr protein kinase